mmetsp:Transcript_56519/g.123594  ORF Transcript_56519/g.123594 Transcript_56519/m.123594 type:complete len:1326 (+) Transcript_56519:84-4061(+)
MSGLEVLAGLGLVATELFRYNRGNFEFDQDQRFDREECRLKMQIERFSLFREDIRDLVNLTVGKMDLYHLIGALFLKMIVEYYCVGFFEKQPPPFILNLYYLSNASAWVFLMLAIWLAMHASISSHSYGTRLLTRFVRLPVPGSAQLNVLNARYADFERQGMQMWRVPFLMRQANMWQQRNAQGQLGHEAHVNMDSTAAATGASNGDAYGSSHGTGSTSGANGKRKLVRARGKPGPGASILKRRDRQGEDDWEGSEEEDVEGPDDFGGLGPLGSGLGPNGGSIGPGFRAGTGSSTASRSPGGYGLGFGTSETPQSGTGRHSRSGASPGRVATSSSMPAKKRSTSNSKATAMNTKINAGGDGGAGGGNGATTVGGNSEDWLGQGEYAYGGFNDIAGKEAEMLQAVEFRTHRHVQLFRQLQSQWQCYDAYARVAMCLGVREMIQSLSYYLIGICLVDQQVPYVAYTLVWSLQCLALGLFVLDIHGLPCYGNLDLSIVGAAPAIIALIDLSMAQRNAEGLLEESNRFKLSCACFALEVCFVHLTLWAAWPTDDENALPRHFRSVLFMDVFSEVEDPLEANMTADGKPGRIFDRKAKNEEERRCEGAEAALYETNTALSRWEAAPEECLSEQQHRTIQQVIMEVNVWVDALAKEIEIRRMPRLQADQRRRRPWRELSTVERETDPHAGSVVGPFVRNEMGRESTYFFDPEVMEYVDNPTTAGKRTLSLDFVASLVASFAQEVNSFCSLGKDPDYEGHPDSDGETTNVPFQRARSQTSIGRHHLKPVTEDLPLRPNRLPWHLLHITSRSVQIVWVFCFIMSVLRITNAYTVDWQNPPRPSNEAEEGGEEGHHGSEEAGGHEALGEEEKFAEEAAAAAAGAGEEEATATGIEAASHLEGSEEPTSSGEEGTYRRRLREQEVSGWNWWRLEQQLEVVSWPSSGFAKPERLSCFPHNTTGTSSLLLGTPFALYKSHGGSGTSTGNVGVDTPRAAIQWQEILGSPQSITVCEAGTSDAQCFLASRTKDSIRLTPFQNAGTNWFLPYKAKGEWSHWTAALLPCDLLALSSRKTSSSSFSTSLTSTARAGLGRCLMAAGYRAGDSFIEVLTSKESLPGGPEHRSSQRTATKGFRTASVGMPFKEAHIAAMHLEPATGRLWAILNTPRRQQSQQQIAAWDLLHLQAGGLLGRWWVNQPSMLASLSPTAKLSGERELERDLSEGAMNLGRDFEITGLCSDAVGGELLAVALVTPMERDSEETTMPEGKGEPAVKRPLLLRGRPPLVSSSSLSSPSSPPALLSSSSSSTPLAPAWFDGQSPIASTRAEGEHNGRMGASA